jgi:DNA-binding response OmpR family regulator
MTERPGAGAGRSLRVLVVEDTAPVRELVARALASEGCVVEQTASAEEARRQLSAAPPEVIVLDVGLPDASGFDLLREIVATSGPPVVMLSSRGEEIDRVLGLELGAEDYVVKPFYPRELAARVRRAAHRARPAHTSRLEFGELVVDLNSRQVTVAGQAVELTAREFDLLAHLAASPRKTFSRHELLEQVWQSSPEWQKPKTVTEHVRRVRNKIEPDPNRPRWIKTVAGVGYRFDP